LVHLLAGVGLTSAGLAVTTGRASTTVISDIGLLAGLINRLLTVVAAAGVAVAESSLVASSTGTTAGSLSLRARRGFLGSITLAVSGGRLVQSPCGRLRLSVGV
jgi:hypothetical protein